MIYKDFYKIHKDLCKYKLWTFTIFFKWAKKDMGVVSKKKLPYDPK